MAPQMVETLKIAILGENYAKKVAQTLTYGECSNAKIEGKKPLMDPFYDMPPLEEDGEGVFSNERKSG